MPTYVLFGKYSLEGAKGVSAQRSEKAMALIKQNGGEAKAVYALLGDTDLVVIAELPDTGRAMKTSLELGKLLGASFRTSPALSVQEFDKLIG